MRVWEKVFMGGALCVLNVTAQVSFYIDPLSGFIPTEMCKLAPKGDTNRFVLVGVAFISDANNSLGVLSSVPVAGFYSFARGQMLLDTIYVLNNPNLKKPFSINTVRMASWVACSEKDDSNVYVSWVETAAERTGETYMINIFHLGGEVSQKGSSIYLSYALPRDRVIKCELKEKGEEKSCIEEKYSYIIVGDNRGGSIGYFFLQKKASRYLVEYAQTQVKRTFLGSYFHGSSFKLYNGGMVSSNYPNHYINSDFDILEDNLYDGAVFKILSFGLDTIVIVHGSFTGKFIEVLNGNYYGIEECASFVCGFAYWSLAQNNANGNFLFVVKSDTQKVGVTLSSVESIGSNVLRMWYNVRPLGSTIDSVWVYFKLLKSNTVLFYDSIYSGVGSYSIDLNLPNFQVDNIRKWAEGSIGPQFVHYWTDSLFAWGGNAVDSMNVDSQWQYEYSAYLFRESGLASRSDLKARLGVEILGYIAFPGPSKSNPFGTSNVDLYVGFSLRDFIETKGKIIAVAYANSNNWYLTVNGDTIRHVQIDVPKEFWFAETKIPSSYAIVVLDCPPIPSDSLFLQEIHAGYKACEFNVPLRNNLVYKTDTLLFRTDSLILEVSFKDGCYWSDKFRVALWDTISPIYNQFCGDLTVSVPVLTEGVELWTPSGQVAFIDTTISTYQLTDTGTYWLHLYDTVRCYIGWSDTFHVWKVGIDSFLLGYEEFCGSVELFGLSDFDIPYYVYRDTLLYLVDTATLFNVDSPGMYIVMMLDSGACRYAQTDPINVEYAGVDTFDVSFDLDCEALVLPDSLSDEQWYVIKDTVFVGVFTGGVVPVSESGVYYLWAMDSSVCRYYRSGGSFVEVMQYDTLLLPVFYQCGNLWVLGGDTLLGRYYLVYEGDTVYVSDSSSFWIDSAGLYWVVYVDTTGCIVGYSDSVLVRRSEVSYPLTVRYSEGVLYVEGLRDVSNVVLYSASGSVGSVPVLVFSSGVCELCPGKPKHRFKVSDLAPGVYVAEIVTKRGNQFYKKVIVR
ncbi:MAG: hypothetical protein GXO48_00335 [Chlorobi bacterium]|nr:hypothetical protein [Chlorobiota bacterium]